MTLLEFIFGPSKPTSRRRRCVHYKTERVGGILGFGGRTRRRCVKYSTSPRTTERIDRERAEREQKTLDRQAEAWLRRDNARRHVEQERQRIQRFAHDARAAIREDKRVTRTRARLKHQGWTDTEIAELERSEVEEEVNPSLLVDIEGRLRRRLTALGHAPAHVARMATLRQSDAGRLNPAAEESEVFHGSPRYTADGGRKLVVGRVASIEYVPPAGSQRAGATFRHVSGDVGLPLRMPGKHPLLVVDPKTNRPQLEMAGSNMRFDDHVGLLD